MSVPLPPVSFYFCLPLFQICTCSCFKPILSLLFLAFSSALFFPSLTSSYSPAFFALLFLFSCSHPFHLSLFLCFFFSALLSPILPPAVPLFLLYPYACAESLCIFFPHVLELILLLLFHCSAFSSLLDPSFLLLLLFNLPSSTPASAPLSAVLFFLHYFSAFLLLLCLFSLLLPSSAFHDPT